MKWSFEKIFSAVKILFSLHSRLLQPPPSLGLSLPVQIHQTSPVHMMLQKTGNSSEPGNNDGCSIRYKGFPPQASPKRHYLVNNVT